MSSEFDFVSCFISVDDKWEVVSGYSSIRRVCNQESEWVFFDKRNLSTRRRYPMILCYVHFHQPLVGSLAGFTLSYILMIVIVAQPHALLLAAERPV
jgi:hypothetical protein